MFSRRYVFHFPLNQGAKIVAPKHLLIVHFFFHCTKIVSASLVFIVTPQFSFFLFSFRMKIVCTQINTYVDRAFGQVGAQLVHPKFR